LAIADRVMDWVIDDCGIGDSLVIVDWLIGDSVLCRLPTSFTPDIVHSRRSSLPTWSFKR
jgi:hypothetical protein